jgi:hypothetical protein
MLGFSSLSVNQSPRLILHPFSYTLKKETDMLTYNSSNPIARPSSRPSSPPTASSSSAPTQPHTLLRPNKARPPPPAPLHSPTHASWSFRRSRRPSSGARPTPRASRPRSSKGFSAATAASFMGLRMKSRAWGESGF